MTFFFRHRILLLFCSAAAVLIAAIFWPEPKKPGEMQKYYSRDQQQLVSLRYQGSMDLQAGQKVEVDYEILREENPYLPKDPVYRINIHDLATENPALKNRVQQLKEARTFYASALVRSIIQDWSAPDYYFIIGHEAARDVEYGLEGCHQKLIVRFKADERRFCIGKQSQGDTRRYVLDEQKNRVLIMPDYTVRRILNNIFAQREQLLHPYGMSGVMDTIELAVGADMMKKLPNLREKTGGKLRLRMLVKNDGPQPLNVWHVENLLSIKPSHAAEFAQLLMALRVNAPFATPALKPDAATTELSGSMGVDAQIAMALSGNMLLKRTDKPDSVLTGFVFYSPGIKPRSARAVQTENTLVRPLDTLVATAFNAGYITADLFPRMQAILLKFESDLKEAAQQGQKGKTEPERKKPASR